jgi:hypothetical protein
MTIHASESPSAGHDAVAVPAVSAAAEATQSSVLQLFQGTVISTLGASSLSIGRSSSGATSIATSAINFSGNVALSVSGLPFGVNYSLSPATIPGTGSSSLVIRASSSARPGTYVILVRTAAAGSAGFSSLTLTIS